MGTEGRLMEIGNGIFLHGDCLELMAGLPDGSVDMVLCDLPYGTTACSWDSVIPFAELWEQYWRVCKPNAAIVLTASQPFTTALIASQMDKFKYCWVWEKSKITGFMQAKNRPLKSHEDICVFGRFKGSAQHFEGTYNPDGVVSVGSKTYDNTRKPDHITGDRKAGATKDSGKGYPRSVLSIPSEGSTVHPTQKPVALFEYLIRTYTNPGELVLDNTAGSGTTAIAAENAGRKWICMERDPDYYAAAVGRVYDHCAG